MELSRVQGYITPSAARRDQIARSTPADPSGADGAHHGPVAHHRQQRMEMAAHVVCDERAYRQIGATAIAAG
jgi:hypothetical protein